MDRDERGNRRLLLAGESAWCWRIGLRNLKVLQITPNPRMKKQTHISKKTFDTTESQTRLFLSPVLYAQLYIQYKWRTSFRSRKRHVDQKWTC